MLYYISYIPLRKVLIFFIDEQKSAGKIISVPILGRELAACCGNGFGCMEQVTAEAESYEEKSLRIIGKVEWIGHKPKRG